MKDFTKKITQILTLGSFGLLLVAPFAIAGKSQCEGSPWQRLDYYEPGSGGACKVLGLDTNKATCPLFEEDSFGCGYSTYCDDASGGRYRLCRGPRNPRCHVGCHDHHRPGLRHNGNSDDDGPRGQDWWMKQSSFINNSF